MAPHLLDGGRSREWLEHTPPPRCDQAWTSGRGISELVPVLVFKRARARPNRYRFFVGLRRNGGAGCPPRSVDLPDVALDLSAARPCGGQTALCSGIRTGVNMGSQIG